MWRSFRGFWAAGAGLRAPALAAALLFCSAGAAQAQTTYSISGNHFVIDGVQRSYLSNSRMVNAIFDDENPATVGMWAYPDTGVWDPQRNTDGLVQMIPIYASDGLTAITVGLQGGRPVGDKSMPQTWVVSAFQPDGSLKPAWMARLDQVLEAADANGMLVIVSLFYDAQAHDLSSDDAVLAAEDNVGTWLTQTGPHAPYTNVLLEIANEINVGQWRDAWGHANLTPDSMPEQIDHMQSTYGIPTSVSWIGGRVPTDAVVQTAQWIAIHGNRLDASEVTSLIESVQASPAYHGQPIVMNEDSTSIDNLNAARAQDVGWGYFDRSFQNVPADWAIDTTEKQDFFDNIR